ncbi:MAG TPA: two-component regulator propeller domain-containing protein [Pyrinomonadaceae bacterium]|nr:two-component regulator propeller domain-containing protein [Pyrinomonadaceae bacterium]
MLPQFVLDLSRVTHAIPLFRALLRQCVWLCLFAGGAFAQYRIDHWTTDNGLPQNTVQAIVQTRDGYLWLTTFDGLARFDGVRFTVFDKNNTKGLTSNRFTALYEDKDGALWAGTEDGGLTIYRHGVFTSYTTADGLPSNQVFRLLRDINGEPLITTPNGPVYMREGKFIPAPAEYQSPDLKFYLGPSGTQWTIDAHGVRQAKDGRVTHYPIKPDFIHSDTDLAPYEDSQGELWLGDRSSLYRLRDGRITRYTATDGLPPGVLLRPECEDNDGGLWLATGLIFLEGVGPARFKDGRFTFYGSDARLAKVNIGAIFKDREGTIWIGTKRGLYRLRKQLITAYSTESGLAHGEVYPLLQARDGHVWIGTIQGLSQFRDGRFENNPLIEPKWIVQALWEDGAGRLWIGAVTGLLRYKDGKLENLSEAVPGATTWAIRTDRAGNLWVATDHGVFKFNGDRVVAHYTTKDGLPGDDVKVIHEDRHGALWFGTYGGLARFKDGRFNSYTTAEGLAGNRVRSIYEDADGTFWIGTYDDGLSRFRDGRFFNYRMERGLYNNGAFQILEDRRGYFWISCNKGVYRVGRRELNDFADGRIPKINCIAYGKQDGMLNSECNGGRQPAGFIARDGKFWFPTMAGVVVIDPEAAPINPQPPPVELEAFLLDREPVAFDRTMRPVRIDPGKENFEIEYTALSFINSEQIKFKYKLAGLDHGWVDVGARRAAYYSYVPPGDYTFTVIAANSDGVWNNQGASLRVVVLAPFYRTWWFITLAILGLVALGFSIYWYRVGQLQKEHAMKEAFSQQMLESQENFSQQLLESQESERGRIAAELHDSLGQRLLVIKNWAALSLMLSPEDALAREQLNEISETASLALEETRHIVYDLRPYQLDKIGLTSTLNFTVEQIAASSGIQIKSEIAELDGVFGPNEEITFYRIVQECLNNIVKHSAATEARVLIERDDSTIKLQVTDNGRGFSVEALDRRKRGFGLAGMAERVRMLSGSSTIESEPGEGATISITIGVTQYRK